jgi:uncharacterized protein
MLSMYALSVAVFSHTLANLDGLLVKAAASAAARKFDPQVFVDLRLAPDMLAFARQVQLACDFAKNSSARLAGLEPPRFEDTERSLDELRARVARTRAYLAELGPAGFADAESRQIVVPLRDRRLELDGLAFLQRWVLPNFFFHVTTAYNILRHNGVDVGKWDFLGEVA